MKRQIQHISIALIITLFNICARAQAPNISYPQSPYNLQSGTSIIATLGSNIAPTNSAGAVPATVYSTVSTYSGGSTTAGHLNSTITASTYDSPRGQAFDYANNVIYVADFGNAVIRKIDIAANTVTTFAGSVTATGTTNGTPGNLSTARFDAPSSITYDGAGNLYIVDQTANQIRKINIASSTITTIASAVTLSAPTGIVYDPTNNVVYIANSGPSTILKMTNLAGTPVVALFAGKANTTALTDGTGGNARFDTPNGIAVDGSGNVYVADQGNAAVRMITPAALVSTLNSSLNTPRAVDVDNSGNVYVADNDAVRMITPAGVATIIAGSLTTAQSTNGVGTTARFSGPRGVTVNNSTGDIYISDYGNNLIRKIIGTGYTINATPALLSGLTFDVTTGTFSGTHSGTTAGTSYTVTAFNAAGSSSATVTLIYGQTVTWDGSNSTAWTLGANWSTNAAPTANDIIQLGTSSFKNQPLITANTSVYSIVFGNSTSTSTGAPITLTLSSTSPATAILTIANSITLNNTNPTIVITASGTGTQNLVMAPGSTITLPTTGKLTISTDQFTLQSDATGSASIGPVTTTNFITSGTIVNVQRYLQGGNINERGDRLMSSPVYTAGTNPLKAYDLNYIENSAVTTGAAGGGFDKSPANPTLYLYREDLTPSNASFGSGNWPGISKINTSFNLQLNSVATNYNLTPGSGFLFFFRGDKTLFGTTALAVAAQTSTSYVPTGTTFTATGILNTGQVIAKYWLTASTTLGYSGTGTGTNFGVRGYNLVGNPYPCSIDWDSFQTGSTGTGIYGANLLGTAPGNATMYVMDPITKTFGSYTSDSGVPSSSFVSNIIASGQGFFVRATAATGATLIFNESAKSVTAQNTGAQLLMSMHTVTPIQPQFLRLQFFKDSVNSEQTTIRFVSQSATNTSAYNAPHLEGSSGVSFSSQSDNKENMGINTAKLPGKQITVIGLNINATANGTYQLRLRNLVAVPKLYDIWLIDAYKKDSLNLRSGIYSLDINKTDSASFGSGRLSLVIRQNDSLAYRLLDFKANRTETGRHVAVLWKTENEENYTNFTVERSTNGGKTFDVLGSVKSDGSGNYSFTDKDPDNKRNYYRLKQEDLNNIITYSKVAEVQFNNQNALDKLRIFPNPATHTINLSIDERDDQPGYYSIRFMNSSGLIVKQFTSSQPDWQGNISNLRPGSYLVRVINTKTQSLVGESKFVKL